MLGENCPAISATLRYRYRSRDHNSRRVFAIQSRPDGASVVFSRAARAIVEGAMFTVILAIVVPVYAIGAVTLAPAMIIADRLARSDNPLWKNTILAIGNVLLFFLVLLPSAFAGWVALALVGPIVSLPASVAGVAIWLALVGIPAPASGSKVAGMGLVLTLVSNAASIVAALVALVRAIV